jgi:hypothetical protein
MARDPFRRPKSRTTLLIALVLAGCGEGAGGPAYYTEASLTDYQGIHVLRLVGTPYEMGLQHGELTAHLLAEGAEFIENDPTFSMMVPLARSMGLLEDAYAYSYPDVHEECEGMTEATRRAGVAEWDLDTCITLAYGDVLFAFAQELTGGGCSQFAAAGEATTDGQLIHARNMDWNTPKSYIIDHPTVIVRRPEGKIPYVGICYPGMAAPSNAINAAGIVVATNDATVDQEKDPLVRGRRSQIQMAQQILATCTSLDEAEAFLASQEHARGMVLMVSDAKNRTAAVFDLSANHMGVTRMNTDGLAYATNHFTHPDMVDLHKGVDPEGSSALRLKRLEELLIPEGKDSLHGQIDAVKGIEVLRDRTNPVTGEMYPPEEFNSYGSIANNGAHWSMIFLPEKRDFYLAAGEPPVPIRRFVGFSLDKLLEDTEDLAPDPAVYD